MSEEIQKTINYLSEKFGAAGAELWKAIVFQMQLEGWIGLGMTAVLILVYLFLFKNRVKIEEKVGKGFSGFNPAIFLPFIIGAGILIFSTLVSIMSLTENISKVMNPQYFAIKEVIK